jgi:hypothetical protein
MSWGRVPLSPQGRDALAALVRRFVGDEAAQAAHAHLEALVEEELGLLVARIREAASLPDVKGGRS